jgi:hypothetical protein
MRARRPIGQKCLAGILALAACSRRPDTAPSRPVDAPPAQTAIDDSVSQGPASEWQIAPGRAGPVTRESSEAELRQHYGASVVESTRIDIGEGETAAGAVLYPTDSLRRAEIVWQDSVNRRRPARLILRGDRTQWQLSHGISLGTNLQELERLNGRPFVLAGFGWDYAGVITDWKGGALDSSLAGIKLYLDPGPAQYESKPYSEVLGDRDYASSLPPMQQLNPLVATIFVDFEHP